MTSSESGSDDVVQLERVGVHIVVVTINRPQARNAVSSAVTRLLEAHVKAIEADATIRVAILTGAGRQAFCAGADLKEMTRGSAGGTRTTEEGGFAGFVFAPRRKLWIAAVNGAAVAGGFELVLACDMVIASTQAVFGLPEVKRGLAATAGGIFRLPRALPRAVALEMIVTGDTMDARRAHALGLVNHLVAPELVLQEALRVAETVSRNAPLAVAWSLELARRAHDFDEAELRRRARELSTRILATEDAREGPRAFAENRAPLWRGC
ncbi:MAG: enoyl-CoA hydratase-related protein [Sulfuricaulis sp.]|nr:enoyl-CoA hydratase-related protein [Sulfuricaulis sp.]